MTFAVALALVWLAVGMALVRWLRPAARWSLEMAADRLALTVMFGLGLGASASVAGALWQGPGGGPWPGTCVLGFIGLGSLRCSRLPSAPPTSRPAASPLAWLVLFLSAAIAVCAAIVRVGRHPDGGWDASMIWNLRARDLFAANDWALALPVGVPTSQPGYPLLVPAAVAALWRAQGHWNAAAPIAMGSAFALAVPLFLFGAVTASAGLTAGLMASAALLSTPAFVGAACDQGADLPMAAWLLLAWALAQQALVETAGKAGDRLLLGAGVACGFAACTKNEGLLALPGVLWAVRGARTAAPWRSAGLLLAGAAPWLIALAIFKLALAPPDDLLAGDVLGRGWRPERLVALGPLLLRRLVFFQAWALFLAAAVAATAWRVALGSLDAPLWRALAVSVAGLLAAYLFSPYDLTWHVRNSIDRELLQLWPGWLFLLSRRAEPSGRRDSPHSLGTLTPSRLEPPAHA